MMARSWNYPEFSSSSVLRRGLRYFGKCGFKTLANQSAPDNFIISLTALRNARPLNYKTLKTSPPVWLTALIVPEPQLWADKLHWRSLH